MLQLEHQNFKKNTSKFRKERARIVGLIGNQFAIHHVGSTAIPNMSGKNILDILIGAPSNTHLKNISQKLVEKGYFMGKNQQSSYIFLASRPEETGSEDTHIHLTITGSKRYQEFLLLKNYLLENPAEANEYQKAKHLIAKTVSYDRTEYKKKKSNYIAKLLKKARYHHEATKDTPFDKAWPKHQR